MCEMCEIYKGIIAVTDRRLCERPFKEQIERVCAAGPEAVILREKDLNGTEYEMLARDIKDICGYYRVPLILHTHVEAAAALGISRVHFTMDMLRRYVHVSYIDTVGASVHSVEEAEEAERLGASYITAGHIYETGCKPGVMPRGTSFLKSICNSVSIPVYAIGGIRPEQAMLEEILSCGAAGACVMSHAMRL